MAKRLTDKQKKKIVADYLETGSINSAAKKNGVSWEAAKAALDAAGDIEKMIEDKKAQNTADILEYMESQRGIVCSIIGKGLAILNDDEKLATATPAQITTALGTLIDKFTISGAIGTSREDDPLSKSLEELAKKGLKSDDK